MANFTDFLLQVAPHCVGAPEAMVVNEIRNAAIEFCDRSWVWIANTAPIGLTANQQDYTLTTPVTGTQIAQPLYGTYSGKHLDPKARDDVIREDADWRNTSGTTPTAFIANDGGVSVSLIPVPSTTVAAGTGKTVNDGLHFTVALKPGRTQTTIPDWICERYLEVISHGALYRMYAMPKKLWTNANLAGAHKTLFEDGIAAARKKASRSFTRASLRNRKDGVANW